MQIKENYPLEKTTTFKTKGVVRFFCKVKNINELKKAVSFAEEKKIGFRVLGQGSNTLFRENSLDILIIRNGLLGIEITERKDDFLVFVGAGEDWDKYVKKTMDADIFGLENLSGIPGFVGTSVVSNIGAYGVEVSEFIKEVYAFNTKTFEEKVFNKRECCLSYRNSFFKENGEWIVIRVIFSLPKKWKPNLSYKDLKGLKFIKGIGAKDIRKKVLEIRRKKLPNLKYFGTAGSFFKNPIITTRESVELSKRFSDLPIYDDKKGFKKVSLAFILDKICGLRGFRRGDVGLYEKQPLVLVNFGNASGKDVLNFAREIEKKVFAKTKIKIEKEIIVL